MAKAIYEGIGGVARKVKNVYEGVGSVARKCMAGWIGVSGVARQFWSAEYSSLLDAYNNGAITSLVAQYTWDKDDGDRWKQYSYVCSYSFSSGSTFVEATTLAWNGDTVTSNRAAVHGLLYIFCPTQDAAKAVAECIKSKYTSVKGYDASRRKSFGTKTITDVTYSTDICANIGLTIGYWRYINSSTFQYSWNASTTSGYSDKYVVSVSGVGFTDSWDDSGDYASNLEQIIFS